jgi:ABC-type nitrate/sulfonate/bicarbonate transport system substrate-binding protein
MKLSTNAPAVLLRDVAITFGQKASGYTAVSGAKSLQALIGGSVDVVTGAYEHTIRMQAKGQDVRALVELGRFPAIVIAVKKDKAGQIKSAADFKGAKIGVTAPGSSTALTAQYTRGKKAAPGTSRT